MSLKSCAARGEECPHIGLGVGGFQRLESLKSLQITANPSHGWGTDLEMQIRRAKETALRRRSSMLTSMFLSQLT